MRNFRRLAVLAAFALASACGGGDSTGPSDHSPTSIAANNGNNQQGTVGAALALAPSVVVKDKKGRVLPGITVTFAVASGGGAITGAVDTTDASGLASVGSWTLGTQVGANTLTATVSGLTPVTLTATGVAGPAAALSFSTAPGTVAQSGVAFSQQPVLQLKDQYGNNATQAGVQVTAAITSGGGTLGGTATVASNANGVVTFTNLMISGTVGSRTLSFSATGFVALVSGSIQVDAGAPANMFNNSPTALTGVVGGTAAPLPSVVVQDASGNPVAGVAVSFTAGTAGDAVTNGLVQTDGSGIATVGGWTYSGVPGSHTLDATFPGSPALTFTATVSAGAASKLVLATAPSATVASGATLAQQPVVQVTDAFGNLISGASATVTAALVEAGATLGGTTVVATSGGVASFTDLSLSGTAGSYTLAFSAPSLTGVSAGVALTAGPATTLALSAGDGQSAVAGSAVAIAPAVLVTDASSNPVSGVSVTFAVATGGGSVTGGSATTNTSGIATVGSWTLGAAVGSNTLTATSGSLSGSPLTFTATGTVGPAATIARSAGDSQSATVGSAVATAPAVLVTDANGNPVSGVAVTFVVASGGGSATGTSASTNVSGIATVGSWTLGTTAGSNTLSASATGLTGSPVSFTATGTPGSASALAFGQQPSQVASGAALAPAVTVRVLDGFGNTVTASSASITMAIGSGPGGAALGGTLTVAATSGVASFGDLTLDLTGSYTLAASAGGLTGATSTTFSVVPGPAVSLQFGQQPTTISAGLTITPAVTVTLHDANGNLVTGSTAAVTLAIGTNPAAGTLSGTLTVNAVAGVATFSDLSINKIGTGYTLSASAGGVTGATSGSFDITPGPAAKLGITQQPGNVVSNATLSPALTVEVQDAGGNVVTGATDAITVAFGTNAGGGTLAGTTTVNAVAGVATFSDLSVNLAGTGYTLAFSASGLTGATSSTFNVTPGAADHLAIQQQPASTTAGAALSPAVTVRIADQAGNTVTGSTAAVTVAIGTNPGSSTLGGTTTVNAVAGVATFSDLTLDKVGAGYTLDFTASGVTGASSNSFDIAPGAAAKLVFGQQPTSATGGATISPAVTLLVQDAAGNTVTGSTASVSLAIGTNPASGTLGGTTTVSAVAGVATFGTLSIDKAGTGYTLAATSSGLTGATSGGFNITAGAPATITITTQPSSSVTNGGTLAQQPVLQLRDPGGNASPTAGVNVLVSLTDSTGVALGGTRTVASNASGVVTFSDLSLTGAAGSYSLTFTSTGLSSATSGNISLVAGAPAFVSAASSTSQAGRLGIAAGTAPKVTVTDASGNPVSGATVTFAVTAGGGTVSGATPTTDALGQATVGGWTFGKTVTTNSVTATVGALPTVTFDATVTFEVASVSAGLDHACALTVDGVAFCWGSNAAGALGDSSITSIDAPVAVHSSQLWASLVGGTAYTCGLLSGGSAYCWGANGAGQLGDGTTTARIIPTAVSGGFSYTSLAASYASDSIQTCGLISGGTLYCWGANNYGQFGRGNTTSAHTPQLAGGGSVYTSVGTGTYFTCGVRTGNLGYCWGLNGFGQLGDSSTSQRLNPVAVKGGLAFSQVVSSLVHSCGRTTGGDVYCWGLNANGRIGQDSLTVVEEHAPVQVAGLTNVVELVAGNAHTCARTSGNQVYCWGLNDSGQLGDATFSNRPSPVAVSLPLGVTGFTRIEAGAAFTCGVTSANAAYCWGEGGSGQRGDGTAADSNIPVQISNP